VLQYSTRRQGMRAEKKVLSGQVFGIWHRHWELLLLANAKSVCAAVVLAVRLLSAFLCCFVLWCGAATWGPTSSAKISPAIFNSHQRPSECNIAPFGAWNQRGTSALADCQASQ